MLFALLLYASLAAPEYDLRESAQPRLTQLIDRHPATYGPRLGSWMASATCPEVRRRTALVLVVYHRWRVNSFVPSGVPCWPICIAEWAEFFGVKKQTFFRRVQRMGEDGAIQFTIGKLARE